MRLVHVAALASLVSTATTTTASAEAPVAIEARQAEPSDSFILGIEGGYVSIHGDDGARVGLTARWHIDYLLVGLQGGATGAGRAGAVDFGALLGVAFDVGPSVRLELAFDTGLRAASRSYDDGDGGDGSTSAHAEGLYLGLRAGVDWRLSDDPLAPTLGVGAYARIMGDLDVGMSAEDEESSPRLGGGEAGIVLRLGFDVLL